MSQGADLNSTQIFESSDNIKTEDITYAPDNTDLREDEVPNSATRTADLLTHVPVTQTTLDANKGNRGVIDFRGVRVRPLSKHKMYPPAKCVDKIWTNYNTFVLKQKINDNIETFEVKLLQVVAFYVDRKKSLNEIKKGIVLDLQHQNKKYTIVVGAVEENVDGRIVIDSMEVRRIASSWLCGLYPVIKKDEEEELLRKLEAMGPNGEYYKHIILASKSNDPNVQNEHFYGCTKAMFLKNNGKVEDWLMMKENIEKEIKNNENNLSQSDSSIDRAGKKRNRDNNSSLYESTGSLKNRKAESKQETMNNSNNDILMGSSSYIEYPGYEFSCKSIGDYVNSYINLVVETRDKEFEKNIIDKNSEIEKLKKRVDIIEKQIADMERANYDIHNKINEHVSNNQHLESLLKNKEEMSKQLRNEISQIKIEKVDSEENDPDPDLEMGETTDFLSMKNETNTQQQTQGTDMELSL